MLFLNLARLTPRALKPPFRLRELDLQPLILANQALRVLVRPFKSAGQGPVLLPKSEVPVAQSLQRVGVGVAGLRENVVGPLEGVTGGGVDLESVRNQCSGVLEGGHCSFGMELAEMGVMEEWKETLSKEWQNVPVLVADKGCHVGGKRRQVVFLHLSAACMTWAPPRCCIFCEVY